MLLYINKSSLESLLKRKKIVFEVIKIPNTISLYGSRNFFCLLNLLYTWALIEPLLPIQYFKQQTAIFAPVWWLRYSRGISINEADIQIQKDIQMLKISKMSRNTSISLLFISMNKERKISNISEDAILMGLILLNRGCEICMKIIETFSKYRDLEIEMNRM